MKKYFFILGLLFLPFYYTQAGMCDDFAWAQLISPDWTYLWVLDASKFNTDSIGNQFSNYWSKFNTKSIFNQFWNYWSKFSDTSPWNKFATKPPLIVKWWVTMGSLTLNRYANWAQNTFDILYCFIELWDDRWTPFEWLNPWWHATTYKVPGSSYWWTSFNFSEEESCQLQYWSNATAWDPWYCKCKYGYKWNSSNTACVSMSETELCQLEYWSNAIAWDPWKCKCKDWYGRSSDMTYCKKMSEDEICKASYWNNAIAWDPWKCVCKDWYGRSSDMTYCKKMSEDEICQASYWIYSYSPEPGLCNCKDWYGRSNDKTSCVKVTRDYDQECRNQYWSNSIASPDDPANLCICKNWYTRNSNMTSCISSPAVTTYTPSTTTYSNWFSQEYNDAYAFAFANRITTMPSIEQANMHWEIIRAEIAKMFANWVKSMWQVPDSSRYCNFTDISSVKWDLYTAIIESCQLGIMWQWISQFRPYDKITRWEVATAVSRILWWNEYDWWSPYYAQHLNALRAAWIISDISQPNFQELRWNVMVMLMKASNSFVADCDDPIIALACANDISDCPDECKSDYISEEDVDLAVEYNDKMVDLAGKCIATEDDITKESEKDDISTNKLTKAVNNTIDVCSKTIKEVNELWDWKWDSTLKDWVLILLASDVAFYKQYLKVIPFLDVENLTASQQEEFNTINEKLEELNKKLDKANSDLTDIQVKFAKRFWFDLDEVNE